MMMLKRHLAFLALPLFLLPAIASTQITPSQYSYIIPQVVAGELGALYRSEYIMTSQTETPGQCRLKYFEQNGAPAFLDVMIDGRLERGSTFDFTLNRSQDTAEFELVSNQIDRVGFVGWARLECEPQVSFASKIFLRSNGTTVSQGISASEPRTAFMINVNPEIGVAVVNPNADTAFVTVKFAASDGNPTVTKTFTLAPGQQIAKFIKEEPFGVTQRGTAVFSSNVPIAPVAFEIIGGTAFSTQPILPPPRSTDMEQFKLGIVYLVPSDMPAAHAADVAEKTDLALRITQGFLDRELERSGYEPRQIPVYRDSKGLPEVEIIKSDKPLDYFMPLAYNYSKVLEEVREELEARGRDWNYVAYWVESIVLREDGFLKYAKVGLGALGVSMFTSNCLYFLKEEYLDNEERFSGNLMPEYGFKAPPGMVLGGTYANALDSCTDQFAHEFAHSTGLRYHTPGYGNPDVEQMDGLMGSSNRLIRPNSNTGRMTRLLASEAWMLSRARLLNRDLYSQFPPGFVHFVPPLVEDLSWSWNQATSEMTIAFRAVGQQSGAGAFALVERGLNGVAYYWSEITHENAGKPISVTVKLPFSEGFDLWVFNHFGYHRSAPLTP